MTASSHLPAPNLMPLMRYRELAEAMGWLEQAFGFEKQIAVADSEGAVIYGQMTYRGGLMMMGAVRDTDLDKLMRQPDEVGGVETQSCYLVVEDADTHYQRALAAGADIVLELKSDGLGRRGYSCRDPEGHIWSFGTYNPGKSLTTALVAAPQPEEAEKVSPTPAAPRRRARLLIAIAGLVLAAGAVGFLLAGGASSEFANRREAERAYAALVKIRSEKRQADERLAALERELDAEKQRAAAALAVVKGDSGATDGDAQTRAVAQEKAGREAAEKEALSLKEALAREQAERKADRERFAAANGNASAKEAPAQAEALAQESAQREAAEQAASSRRDELKREQAERDAVEAKRILEEKLAAVSSSEAAVQQSRTAEPAAPKTEVAAAPDRIETSATRRDDAPRTEAPLKLGADPKKSDLSPKRERAQRSVRPRKIESASRYPAYVTDMKQVWPYQHWTQ